MLKRVTAVIRFIRHRPLAAGRRLLMAAGLATALASGIAHPADPPTAAQLRIDPAEHTAIIKRIATDRAGQWLVTASDDKTARIWSLRDGRLAAVLRPPLGPGDEGKLYAVALSPDGQTVAVGGWTGYDWDESVSVYLYDRASTRLLRRLDGLPTVVLHLAFSPDGRQLAVALGAGQGIRLFDPASGRLLGEDRDFGKGSYGVDFSPDGRRLVATCIDGELRLYAVAASGLTRLARRAAPGGREPYLARFSPDGQRIAVGFNDTAAVNVLDATTLALRFAPETTGVNDTLSSPAWSADGAWLYAAGNADRDGQFFVRRWPVTAQGAGTPSDWPVAGSTIVDLAALPGGALAFGSAEPTWGVLDATGRRRLHHAPAVADFRDMLKTLTLSPDGRRVGFGYEYGGRTPAVFDAASPSLLPAGAADLAPPRVAAPGLAIEAWQDTRNPTLNGRALALQEYERSRSLALLPGPSGTPEGFVLGADWSLRAFDRDGKQRWKQAVPGVVWAVNVSADGRWVVAAYGDGTLRWHRASDGVEQLALYPHPDRKRWVLWTPSGFYDASPGAEDLIGWHVNRGKDQAADFFPASRFRAQFYRPDVIAALLDSTDEATALARANAEAGRRTQTVDVTRIQPPVVRIASPVDGERFASTNVTLRYRVRAPADAPVTGAKVLVDGRPLEEARGLRPVAPPAQDGEQEFRLDLTLPSRDVTLSVLAENRNGINYSQSVRLVWAGAAQNAVPMPVLYVVAVGVNAYRHPDIRPLEYAAKDARDFAAALQRQKGRLYRDVQVRLLVDADATRDGIVDALEWLERQVTQHDVGVLFIGGHAIEVQGQGYTFLPVNADPERLKVTGVKRSEVESTLGNLAGKALFFFDTCHAGNVLGKGRKALGDDLSGLVKEMASIENGVVVFSSSTGRQFSLEDPAWANGAFTKAVVEGLDGAAAQPGNPRITHKMLDYYVSERVKALTGGRQTPITGAPEGSAAPDFPIAVKVK